MATKTNGVSPDQRRRYDEAFEAEAPRLAEALSCSTQATARQLGIRSKLRYRCQQVPLVAVVGIKEVARGS